MENLNELKHAVKSIADKEAWRFFSWDQFAGPSIPAPAPVYLKFDQSEKTKFAQTSEFTTSAPKSFSETLNELLIQKRLSHTVKLSDKAHIIQHDLKELGTGLYHEVKTSGQGSLVEIIDGNGFEGVFNLRTHFQIEPDTKVDITVILINVSGKLIYQTNLALENNKVHFTFLNLGSQLLRFEPHIELKHKQSELSFYGLNLLKDHAFADVFSTIEHMASESQSAQVFKNLVDDESRAIFTGNIKIDPGLHAVNSSQLSRHMLLSSKAQAVSRPQLEIYSFDVKCSHGSSTGQLSDEELFYFTSRGIEPMKAKRILTNAQAREVIFNIQNKAVQAEVLRVMGV